MTKPDFEYWAKNGDWMLDEATALSLGLAPDWLKSRPRSKRREEDQRRFTARAQLAERATINGQVKFHQTGYVTRFKPADYLDWLDRIDELYPPSLRTAVEKYSPSPPPTDSTPVGNKICAFSDETNPNERMSLHMIILALMGMDKTEYDSQTGKPAMSAAISAQAKSIGLPISEDTVKRHLNRAAETAHKKRNSD